MNDDFDKLAKLFIAASPAAQRAVLQQVARDIAERQVAAQAGWTQAALKVLAPTIARLADQIDKIDQQIDAIIVHDGQRKYLAALNAASHVNGRLHVDAQKLQEELAK